MALRFHSSDSLSPDERKHLRVLSKEDAYTWINAKRQQAKQLRVLCDLDTIYNSYAPVNRLPNEIFLEVVYHIKGLKDNVRRDFSWLELAGVCRDWRRILLATPMLWATIDISLHPYFVHLCLERSRNALIAIHDGYKYSLPTKASLEALLPHMDRVRSLSVDRLGSSSMETLLSRLTGTMPHLERLKVGQKMQVLQRFSPSGQLPRLRSLILSNICVPWSSPILTGLSELGLSFQEEARVPELSLETLLDILEASPRLTVLCVQKCALTIPEGAVSSASPTRIVKLPELRKLTLSERPSHTSRLLAHLVLPADVFIDMCPYHMHMTNGDEVLANPILDMFPDKLPNLADVAHVRLIVANDYFFFDANVSADTSRLRIELDCYDFGDPEELVVPAICDIGALLASSPLRCIVITADPFCMNDREWDETLGCFASVEELEINIGDDSRSFWRVLGSSRDNGELYCPCLEKLHVGGIGLDDGTALLVIECLQNRMLHGHRLKTLEYCCRKALSIDHMHSIETLVDSFHH